MGLYGSVQRRRRADCPARSVHFPTLPAVAFSLLILSCRVAETSVVPSETALVHPQRSIRVLMLRDIERFEFAVSCPFRVLDAAGKELSETLPPLGRTPALIQRRSRTALILGGQRFAETIIDLVPARNGAISLQMPAGSDRHAMRRLPGYLRCVLKSDGTAEVINVVDVEDYLAGVLRGEVPPNWNEETNKAQAIAARTYVLYEKNTVGRRRTWDVTATARSQMYIGIAPDNESTRAAAAVRATHGIVCTWGFPDGDRIFCTYYSAVCGGETQDASLVNHDPSIPPLAGGVRCNYCMQAPKGTYRWGPIEVSHSIIENSLRTRYRAVRKLGSKLRFETAGHTPDRRVRKIRILDQTGDSVEISAESFRLTVDPTGMMIKSTHFQMTEKGETVWFTHGHGWGHGLGMCQWGAQGLGRRGKSAEEILSFYYPGSKLTKAYD